MNTYDYKEKTLNARAVICDCATKLVESGDEKFMLISPDISRSSFGSFIDKYPDRHFNVGIAEQNAIDFATGMSLEGLRPVVYGMSTFLSMRCCEQVRTNICYQDCNVKVITYSSGITGNGGSTHSSLEDLGLMRLFSNMTVVLPGDPQMVEPMFKAIYAMKGPAYMRIGGSFPETCVYKDLPEVVIGKGIEITDGSDATVFATGITVADAVEASKRLLGDGIKVSVVDMHTLKPIDKEIIVKKAQQTGKIVTVEDHTVFGGLGTAVAEVLADSGIGCRFTRLGVPDVYPGYGSYADLTKQYGFDSDGIARAVKALM